MPEGAAYERDPRSWKANSERHLTSDGVRAHEAVRALHRVLNRTVWLGREAVRLLLGLLVEAFGTDDPLIISVDEMPERRWGTKIADKGIYRDLVRSSHEHFVKASALCDGCD